MSVSNAVVRLASFIHPHQPCPQHHARWGQNTAYIAALISELLETHAQKCDEGGDCANDRPRHVISEVYGTSANIDSLAICEIEMGTQIYLVLDDHSAFRIAVEAVSP